MTKKQERIEATFTEIFRESDTVIDEQGGWYHAQQQFHELMDRTELEMDWPVKVEIQFTAEKTHD